MSLVVFSLPARSAAFSLPERRGDEVIVLENVPARGSAQRDVKPAPPLIARRAERRGRGAQGQESAARTALGMRGGLE